MKNNITFFTAFFFTSLLLLLTACSPRRQIYEERNDIQWDQSQVEARLYDVPLIVGAYSIELLSDEHTKENIILSYKSNMDCAQATVFYQEQLERTGWNAIAIFTSDAEILLNFEKPQKYCSISLRSCNNVLLITIFVGQKIN